MNFLTARLYEVNLRVEGFLIFSSEVMPRLGGVGSLIATSPYVHNYPVIYSLLNMSSETYYQLPSLHLQTYSGRKSRGKFDLRYTTIMRNLQMLKQGKKGVYAFPLRPIKLNVMTFFLSSESWGYGLLTRLPTKNVFPRATTYVGFGPESEFTTYVVTVDTEIPEWIRIGKKRWGLLKVRKKEVEIKGVKKATNISASTPINLYDTKLFDYNVKSFSKVLETHSKPKDYPESSLIGYAQLEECEVLQINMDELCLPLPHKVIEELK